MINTAISSEDHTPNVPLDPPPVRWIAGLWTINLFFLAISFYGAGEFAYARFARPLNLGQENNFAAWWSGTQLLIVAMLLHTLVHSLAANHRRLSRGLLALSILITGIR
ncbi:MAG: hypothetical protein ACREX4_06430 [Gammaproteobacteria bacterium]